MATTANGDADDDGHGDDDDDDDGDDDDDCDNDDDGFFSVVATRAGMQAPADAERLQPATALRHELSKSQPPGGQSLPLREKIRRRKRNATVARPPGAGRHCCATARGRSPLLRQKRKGQLTTVWRPPGVGRHCCATAGGIRSPLLRDRQGQVTARLQTDAPDAAYLRISSRSGRPCE